MNVNPWSGLIGTGLPELSRADLGDENVLTGVTRVRQAEFGPRGDAEGTPHKEVGPGLPPARGALTGSMLGPAPAPKNNRGFRRS